MVVRPSMCKYNCVQEQHITAPTPNTTAHALTDLMQVAVQGRQEGHEKLKHSLQELPWSSEPSPKGDPEPSPMGDPEPSESEL